MYYVLLHVSEFGSLVSAGQISIYSNRIKCIDNIEVNGVDFLSETPFIRHSEPEAYVIARIEENWKKSIISSHARDAMVTCLSLEAVDQFSAITSTANKLLSSRAERLCVKLGPPLIDAGWDLFCNNYEFYERHNSSNKFMSLFGNRFVGEVYKAPDLSTKDLLTKPLPLQAKSQLENSIGLAKYGIFEFSIRLAGEFNDDWRKTEKYKFLKDVRERCIGEKKESELHFLKQINICFALQNLSSESKEKFGYEPLALACLYQCLWKYDLNKKIAIEEIHTCAKLLVELGMASASAQFLSLIGFLISPEDINLLLISISPAKYPALSYPAGKFEEGYFNLDDVCQTKTIDDYLDQKSIKDNISEVLVEANSIIQGPTDIETLQSPAELKSENLVLNAHEMQDNLGQRDSFKIEEFKSNTPDSLGTLEPVTLAQDMKLSEIEEEGGNNNPSVLELVPNPKDMKPKKARKNTKPKSKE